MLRFFAILIVTAGIVAADTAPAEQTLKYAADTGDVEGAARLADFYARSLPAEGDLYKALAKRLRDGSWQSIDADARAATAAFGFTPPPPASKDVVETFVRAVVVGIAVDNLKLRTELAAQYAEVLPDEPIFPWMVTRLDEIRDQEIKRVSLLKRGQMIVEEANRRMQLETTPKPAENRYEKLQQIRETTTASELRRQAAIEKLQLERNRGLAMVNESYDYPEASQALQVFVREAAATFKESRP